MAEKGQKREYGSGSVIKRGNLVGVVVSLGKNPDGTRHRQAFLAPTMAEARAKAEVAKVAHRQGKQVKPTAYTIQHLFDKLLPLIQQTRREKTYIEYEGFYRLHIAPRLATLPLSTLTAAHVQEVLSAMTEKGLSPSTVYACRKVFSSALEYGRKWKWIEENPARDADVPRIERKEARQYTIAQTQAILRAIDGISAQHLLTFCLAAVVRPSEGAGIRTSDLIRDESGNLIAVRITAQLQHSKGQPGARAYRLAPLKTDRSYRTVPLSNLAREAIEESLKREYTFRTGKLNTQQVIQAATWAQEAGLVFRTAVGTPHTPEGIRKQFYAALEKAGLPRVTRHELRHIGASLLIDAGESPATVAAILGDDPRTVMGRYVHSFAASNEAAMQALGKRLTTKLATDTGKDSEI